MSFKCEDLQEGDTLRCIEGNGCCHHTGKMYQVTMAGGKPRYRTDCGETFRIEEWQSETVFELANGPW